MIVAAARTRQHEGEEDRGKKDGRGGKGDKEKTRQKATIEDI